MTSKGNADADTQRCGDRVTDIDTRNPAQAGTAVSENVSESAPKYASEATAKASELWPGMMFHNYQLIRELGRGGMGLVYLARDIRLGRRVAMKFLDRQNKSRAARLLSEARATARCEHDNIVGIYHADEAQGYSYLVLEYLEGVTLRQWMQQHWQHLPEAAATSDEAPSDEPATTAAAIEVPSSPWISPTLAVEFMVPVVRALAHAHQLGLVHRDLKPENIMLTDEGTIKVLDFGIVKLLDQHLLSLLTNETAQEGWDAHQVETREGALLGTLPYMSPEQWGTGEIDGRSDIWAVGIMLWELCTGRHPLAPFMYSQLGSVPDLEVPMPSLAREHPEVGPLAEIVDRCLIKPRAERMPSAPALLAALEPLLPGCSTVLTSAAQSAELDNPYVGLAAFQESDAARFFGRDREIASVVGQLRNHCLVTVAGASGTGKSSFVRAGVLPALARSGQTWEWFLVRPGRQPLAGLAEVLGQVAKMSPDSAVGRATQHPAASGSKECIAALRAEPGMLGTVLRARCHRRRSRILLFVDQFEELYTLGAQRDTREAFVRCLEGVADDASSPLRVVLAMRSDFIDRVAEDRAFMSEITRGLWFLPPMQRDEMRQALLRPLHAVGYELDDQDRMIATMLGVLEDTRAPLPLLQFTAARLWDMRDREQRHINRASYDQLGGIAGALAAHADTVLTGLSAHEQRLARIVFTSLVTEERTRAIVSLDELCALAPDRASGAMEDVVQHLVAARLLVMETDADIDKDGATVEIAHESLIERWPRLGQWLTEDQEEGAFRTRLRAAAREWHKQGRSEDLLWRGQAADGARRWLERWRNHNQGPPGSTAAGDRADLGAREQEYLHAVVGLATRTRRRRQLMAIAAFAVVSLFAVHEDRLADEAAKHAALADEKAALAASESIQARNASRMASAREYQSDATLVLALVRELEASDKLPLRWRDLARWAMYQGVAKVVFTHRDVIHAAAFSPDGTRIVTASGDSIARVWNADGSGTPMVLQGHQDVVYDAVFSPDGARIVTASGDRTARVWTADGSGMPIVLHGHQDRVYSAAFSPDGTRIVTASGDKTARVWNADGTGTPIVLYGHRDFVNSAQFSPNGTRVVTASFDKTARVWSVDDANPVRVLRGHQDMVYSAAFSPDGTRIVTASVDKTARVWSAEGSGGPRVLQGHQDIVASAAFSPDGTRIVTTSWDKTVRVWSVDGSGTPLVLRGHQDFVRRAAFSPDGKRIVTASFDKTVRVWTADGLDTPRILQGHRDRIYSAAFSPDGTRIVTASFDKTARVWTADGMSAPVVLRGHHSLVTSAGFSPDGTRIVTASFDNTARVWSADGSGAPEVLRGHRAIVTSAGFSPDGKHIVTASFDNTARVWTADGSGAHRVLQGHQDRVYTAAFSPDSTRIVTASWDKTARVWNADGSGAPIVLRGHEDVVTAAAFSPDGTRIVTTSFDKTARVWNADGSGVPRVLEGHSAVLVAGARGSQAFSPDGTRVVTISDDKTIRVWTIDGPDEPVILRAPDLDALSVAFSPDGTRIVSASHHLAATGKTRHVAKVWTGMQQFRGLDDPKLWTATNYCPPIELRMELLGVSETRAAADLDRCRRRVAEARGRQTSSQP